MSAKHATQLKGVYNLNPTNAVMKQGSKLERDRGMGGRFDQSSKHPGDERADFESEGGVEEQVHHMNHPAMQTRHSHPSEHKHSDGRKHEDHHHAVKKMKG
jgi:hypothetical protein